MSKHQHHTAPGMVSANPTISKRETEHPAYVMN